MAVAADLSVGLLETTARRLRGLRDGLIDGVLAAIDDVTLNGALGDRRFLATRTSPSAAARGLVADAVGRQRHRVLHRFGLYPPGWRVRRMCCWRWASPPNGHAARCDCPWGTPLPGPTWRRRCGYCPPRSIGPDKRPWPVPRRSGFGEGSTAMKVLAAMSGGVDSSGPPPAWSMQATRWSGCIWPYRRHPVPCAPARGLLLPRGCRGCPSGG